MGKRPSPTSALPSVQEDDGFFPINSINQFTTDWRFKARLLKKSIREYKNDRGQGHICNLDLIDKDGTMIQATFFNDMAQKWHATLEGNKVYIWANGQVKMA